MVCPAPRLDRRLRTAVSRQRVFQCPRHRLRRNSMMVTASFPHLVGHLWEVKLTVGKKARKQKDKAIKI